MTVKHALPPELCPHSGLQYFADGTGRRFLNRPMAPCKASTLFSTAGGTSLARLVDQLCERSHETRSRSIVSDRCDKSFPQGGEVFTWMDVQAQGRGLGMSAFGGKAD